MSIDMDKRLERIENKLDDTNEHLSAIDKTLAAQHVSLVEHIKRSDMLEKKLAPVEKHVAMVEGALKLIGVLATIAAIVEAIKVLK